MNSFKNDRRRQNTQKSSHPHPQQQPDQMPYTTPQPHALDPNVQQILPLESTLLPIAQNTREENIQNDGFDLLELMNEVDDDQLLMATQQIEKEHTKVQILS